MHAFERDKRDSFNPGQNHVYPVLALTVTSQLLHCVSLMLKAARRYSSCFLALLRATGV